MLTTTKENLKQIYEEDFLLWIEKTIKLLSDRQLEELDYENLIEELATLGRSEIRAFENLIINIIFYLLLYQYGREQEDNINNFLGEIINIRSDLNRHFLQKTFYNHGINELETLYQYALEDAILKSNLKCFPGQCPYTFAQILDENYLPAILHNEQSKK